LKGPFHRLSLPVGRPRSVSSFRERKSRRWADLPSLRLTAWIADFRSCAAYSGSAGESQSSSVHRSQQFHAAGNAFVKARNGGVKWQ